MRSVLTAFCAAVAAFALGAPAALAQDDGVHDPPADSPAGTVYEIPLEQGRQDAAPPAGDRDAGGTATPAPGTSSIRSENGFSSSSTVPGTSAAGGGAKGSRGDTPAKDRSKPSGKGEENPETGIPRGAAAASAPRPASVPRTLLLIGLAAGVALALAAAVRSSKQR
jgi:hypothetical protein